MDEDVIEAVIVAAKMMGDELVSDDEEVIEEVALLD